MRRDHSAYFSGPALRSEGGAGPVSAPRQWRFDTIGAVHGSSNPGPGTRRAVVRAVCDETATAHHCLVRSPQTSSCERGSSPTLLTAPVEPVRSPQQSSPTTQRPRARTPSSTDLVSAPLDHAAIGFHCHDDSFRRHDDLLEDADLSPQDPSVRTMATEATFTVPSDQFPLGTVFDELPDVTVELERIVPARDVVIPYFWVRGTTVADVESAFAEHPGVMGTARRFRRRRVPVTRRVDAGVRRRVDRTDGDGGAADRGHRNAPAVDVRDPR